MDNTETFRQLLGANLAQLSFAERQTIAQCLISTVIVTGEAVDIQFVLPFASTPQVSPRPTKGPEGTPGHFYRLRLAHFARPAPGVSLQDPLRLAAQSRRSKIRRGALSLMPLGDENADIRGQLR